MQKDDADKKVEEMDANSDTTTLGKLKEKYNVISVEKSAAPAGMPGDNWYRYIIGEGGSKIEGKKPGTLKAVTQHAETVAEDLNSRSVKGRSAYSPHKK